MKTMIFSGRTMREAMAQAKQRFGADIDILSSDQVGDEVQVTVVVPEAGGGRRRKAVERVSASIKALADAPMKGERASNAAKGIETADMVAASPEASASAPDAQAGTHAGTARVEADEVVQTAGTKAGKSAKETKDAKQAKETRTGRTTRLAKGAKTGTRKTARSAKAETLAEADGSLGADASVSDAECLTGAGSRVSLEGDQQANDVVGQQAASPDVVEGANEQSTGPLSTLDFERQRRLRQEKHARAGSAGAAAGAMTGVASGGVAGSGAETAAAEAPSTAGLPTQASSLVHALVAAQAAQAEKGMTGQASAAMQPGVPVGMGAVAGVRVGVGTGVQPGGVLADGVAGATVAGQAVPVGSSAGGWRMAGQPVEASAGSNPAASSGVLTGVATGAAEAGQVPAASRLSLVLNSARRMLSGTPGRWLGRWGSAEAVLAAHVAAPSDAAVQAATVAVGTVAVGDADAVARPAGFGQEAPMPLSSLLQSDAGTSEWPSLSLQADEGTSQAGNQAAVADAPPSAAQAGAPMLAAGGERDAAQIMATPVGRESRLTGVGWFETARRRPGQMRLLRNLLACQFSPALARTLVSLLPVDYSDVQADEWLRQMMLRALAGVNGRAGILPGNTEQTIFDKGGVFALIGPTGVGKTTSIAKIAAHHVLRHGPKSLALITADVYRIGAQEQLRAFGKMLGVPVQVAQDRDVLQTLLKEHESRGLVLIDTAGISQRDERVSKLTSALSLAQVKRVLVLNAGTQPGGIEDVLRAFRASETAGVLLSKVDEAVGLGACFDALIRHRLPLVGYTDGQRVPEDYHPANLGQLIESALSGEAANQYPSLSMTDSEMRHLFEGAHV
ncbi:MAG: hypothetical protein Q4D91_01680 [Lautropia sp.]|nr:hypothetical protein [Lautropia sp.]